MPVFLVFREAFLQKGRQPCAAALFLPRWYNFCNPAPQRLLVRPAFTPRPYPGSPRFCHMPVPVGSEGGRPLYPRARRHALRTVCPLPRYPPPRPFRRRIPPRHGPVWRQHRRQFTQKGSIEPAVALAAVRAGRGVFTRFFARPFCKKAATRAAALYLPHLPSSAPSAPRISALTNRRRCGRISLPANPECNTVRRRTQ